MLGTSTELAALLTPRLGSTVQLLRENLGNSAKRNFGKRLFDEADTSICNSLSKDSDASG